jgi:hypothetical protein
MKTALFIASVTVAFLPLAVALAVVLFRRGEDPRFAGDKLGYRS